MPHKSTDSEVRGCGRISGLRTWSGEAGLSNSHHVLCVVGKRASYIRHQFAKYPLQRRISEIQTYMPSEKPGQGRTMLVVRG